MGVACDRFQFLHTSQAEYAATRASQKREASESLFLGSRHMFKQSPTRKTALIKAYLTIDQQLQFFFRAFPPDTRSKKG